MCARVCVCVYLMNSVSLCCSARGLVWGSMREGCTLRCVFVYLQLRLLHTHTRTHVDYIQRNTHSGLCALTVEESVILVEFDVTFSWG